MLASNNAESMLLRQFAGTKLHGPIYSDTLASQYESKSSHCPMPTSNPYTNRHLRFESLENRRLLAVLTVQNNLDDSLENLAGDGELSLREAIYIANNSGEIIDGFVSNDVADEVNFAVTGVINITDELAITDELTLTGPGQELLAIDAQQRSRVINFTAPNGTTTNDNLTLVGLTITGGLTTEDNTTSGADKNTHSGGGIRFLSNATITLNDSTVTGNRTEGFNAKGGGLYTRAGDVVLNNSLIQSNSAAADGGGIFARTGAVLLNASSIVDNGVSSDVSGLGPRGGGIFADLGGVTLNGGTLSGNRDGDSFHNGSGIHTQSASITLSGDIFANTNKTPSQNGIFSNGGGIFLTNTNFVGDELSLIGTQSGDIRVVDSTITGESVSGAEIIRGIDSQFGLVTIDNSQVHAKQVYTEHGALTLTSSTLTGGNAYTRYSPVMLLNSVISDSESGGIFTRSGDVTLTNSTVRNNSRVGSGAGIHTLRGGVTLINSTLSGNHATGNGGAIYSEIGAISLTNSTISGNSSAQHGGGIYVKGGHVSVALSTITQNSASNTGGGLSLDPNNFSNIEMLSLRNSIVAGNTDDGTANNFLPPEGNQADLLVEYSLIGDGTGTLLPEAQTPDMDGNLIGLAIASGGGGVIDPRMGPLADNGGPTQTHELLTGSPALDGGDPTFDPSVFTPPLVTDQRGANFDRVVSGRLDIGAYEAQASVAADLNQDGFVDGLDLGILLGNWEQTVTAAQGELTSMPPVDGLDLGILLGSWNPLTSLTASSFEAGATLADPRGAHSTALIHAAIAFDQLGAVDEEARLVAFQVAHTHGVVADAALSQLDIVPPMRSSQPETPAKRRSPSVSGITPELAEDILERVLG